MGAGPGRAGERDFAAGAFSVAGGARTGWWHATWPFALLTADSAVIHISLRFRHVWIDRDEVWQVRRRSRGSVAFDSHDRSLDSVAWFGSADEVLAALARMGWPIEPAS